jgi:precorrin-8X/cobalt-precorrin-8 methylmutase
VDIIWNPLDIEKKSMAIIEEKLPELALLPPGERAIIKRVVHTTGDPGCAELVKISPGAVEAGIGAIRGGCGILADVNMVRTGLIARRMEEYGVTSHCLISHPEVVEQSRREGITRAMAAMKKGACLARGGIVAIGNAPTALFTLLTMINRGEASPALVVGTPVGFVGAAESKEALIQAGVPYITLPGTRGGSTIAATIVNALLLMS